MATINLPKPPPVRFVVMLGILSLLIFAFSWVYTGRTQHSLSLSGATVSDMSYAGAGVTKGIGGSSAYQNGMVAYDESASSRGGYATPKPSLMPVPPGGGTQAPVNANKIIRNANLALLVHDTEEAAAGVREIRVRYNGQPGNEQFSEYREGMQSGVITIWVPAEHFDKALSDIKALALRVNNENVSVTDVSAQFTDLEAQLRTHKAAEVQYLEIMKRSGDVSDVLQVAQALVTTRQQIEYVQGQLNQLSTQVTLSSITVSLTPESKPGEAASDWRPGTVAKEALKGLVSELTQFANMLIAGAIRLPALILELAFYGLILWGLFLIGKWAFAKVSGKPLPTGREGV